MQDGNTSSVKPVHEVIEDLLKHAAGKGAELVKKVNVPGSYANVFGITELTDVVDTYFDICSVLERKFSGQPVTIAVILTYTLPGILPCLTGIGEVPNEIMDLIDTEISSLLAIGNEHQLGANAEKYKSALKLILVGFQTFSIFKK